MKRYANKPINVTIKVSKNKALMPIKLSIVINLSNILISNDNIIYDINNLLKSYELINDTHIIEKELVDLLWK